MAYTCQQRRARLVKDKHMLIVVVRLIEEGRKLISAQFGRVSMSELSSSLRFIMFISVGR